MIEETVVEIADAVRRGERKAVEVLDVVLAEVEDGNERLNAFVHLDPDLAREAAERVDAAVGRGDDPGPLAGVPFGVKDLEDCAGMPTSHGSLPYKGRPPVGEDSIHVARLRAAGAVPIGKTAAPEFGTLNFTKTKAWGVTRNPWDTSRTPGGSSGGSAAAVAAGIVPMGTASDGGGSTRIPAGFSGLVGMKPSHGRIPHPGEQPSQTSVFGILVTTVRDSARHLDVAAGPDARDRVSLPPAAVSYEEIIETLDVGGLRARVSLDLGFAVIDPEVGDLVEGAATQLIEAAGLVRDDEPVELRDPARVWQRAGYMDLWMSMEHDMWPAVADDLTLYSRQVLEQTEGYPVSKAAAVHIARQELQDDSWRLFEEVDVVLCPTTAVPAFPAEGPPTSVIAGRELSPIYSTPYTMLANLTGNPAISVPAGVTSEGLPVGLQIIGRRFADEVVLRLARILEQARPWPRHAPAA